jgi:cellulose biosynthesis protein BcsQ
MRFITIISKKGGVGKSATALGLGAALAARGSRVCLVDTDASNRTLSNSFYEAGMMTLPDLLAGQKQLFQATPIRDNLFLIAGHESLERVDTPAVARYWAQLPARFQDADGFDYVIFDTPAGWNLPAEMAARVALGAEWGLCLLPVASAVESFESAHGTMQRLAAIAEKTCAKRLRLLLTMRTPAWQNSEDAVLVGDMAHEAGMRFATAQIPYSMAMRRLSGSSLTPHDEGARAPHLKRAYDALASEVQKFKP